MKLPYSDEYMTYNFTTHRYVLTKKDLLDNFNENLQVKFKDEKDITPFLENISHEVYNYIHKYNVCDELQDFIIAQTESGRKIIRQAMESQAIYEIRNGNLLYSANKNERELAYTPELEDILLKLIPEIGAPIIHTGNLRPPCPPPDGFGEW